MIKSTCPTCNQHVDAPEELVGEQVTCPSCEGPIWIAAPKPIPPTPTPPAPKEPTSPLSAGQATALILRPLGLLITRAGMAIFFALLSPLLFGIGAHSVTQGSDSTTLLFGLAGIISAIASLIYSIGSLLSVYEVGRGLKKAANAFEEM